MIIRIPPNPPVGLYGPTMTISHNGARPSGSHVIKVEANETHLLIARDRACELTDSPAADCMVQERTTCGPQACRRPDGIGVVPLGLLAP